MSSTISLSRIFGADAIEIFAVGEGVEVSTKSKPAYCLWIHGRSVEISRRDCLLSESRIKKKTR